MKITGVDGLTPDTVRGEIERGARFVMYTYCVSLLLVTFKRPSTIYLIRPGQSRITRGLPWSLVSLVAGWWGLPWGPIYTVGTLVKNFSGGVDMTDDVLEVITPSRSDGRKAARPPEPAESKLALTPAQRLLTGAFAVAILLLLYAAWCDNSSKHTVVLLSGLPEPYTVELNETRIELPPGDVVRLTRGEGEFTLRYSPGGGTEIFRVRTPFWTRPFKDVVVVINPDRIAPYVLRDIIFSSEKSRASERDEPAPQLFLNQRVNVLPRPEYVFELPPQKIPLKAGLTRQVHRALTAQPDLSFTQVHDAASTLLGEEAARRYVEHLLAVRADEPAVRFAAEALPPAEALAQLEKRIEARPVLMEVHRYYQQLTERLHPNVDLAAMYRAWSAADPRDGALLYLLGRVTSDDVSAREYYRRSLSAPQPSPYGHVGLGAGCLAAGDFDDALKHYRLAEEGGVENPQVHQMYQEALVALQRYDDLLADIQRLRLQQPRDLELAAAEVRLQLLRGAGRSQVAALIDALCATLNAEPSQERAQARVYLEAQAAYARGDEAGFAEKIAQLPGSLFAFQAAVTRGDCDEASRILAGTTAPVRFHLAIYLAAMRSGRAAAAEAAWKAAMEAIPNDSRAYQSIARFVAAPGSVRPEWVCLSLLSPADKRVFLTALGLRYPQHRAVFHRYAALFNREPVFPQLLVKSVSRPEAER